MKKNITTWRSSKTKENLFNALETVKELILFDVETSGFNAEKERIIQISGIKFAVEEGYSLIEKDRLDLYIRPPFEISEKITEITGITNEFLYEYEEEEYIFNEIYDFFRNSAAVAGYNVSFDERFLAAMYERNGETIEFTWSLDLYEMAKDLVSKNDIIELLKSEGEDAKKENYKLGTIARLYGADKGIVFHSSMDDVIASSRLLTTFIHEYLEKGKEAKEASAPEPVKSKASIISVSFWEGFGGFSRIYVNTNLGTVYFDVRRKTWGEKNEGCMQVIDMELLEQDAYCKVGASDQHEFARYKG